MMRQVAHSNIERWGVRGMIDFLIGGFYFAKIPAPMCGCPAMRAMPLLSRVEMSPQSIRWSAHDGLSRVMMCPPQHQGAFISQNPVSIMLRVACTCAAQLYAAVALQGLRVSRAS